MANVFLGLPAAPSDADLTAALGPARPFWDRLRAATALSGEWYSYSKKAGWSMRLKSGGRNVVYLVPARGGFDVSFALGGRAVAAARDAGLARRLEGAKTYAEGTNVRFPVASAADLADAVRLVEIKLAH